MTLQCDGFNQLNRFAAMQQYARPALLQFGCQQMLPAAHEMDAGHLLDYTDD
jgi:hypothetical protein